MTAIATCAHLILGGYDVTADFTELTINYGSEVQDKTTFGRGTRINAGGLKVVSIPGAGYLSLGSSGIEAILFARLGADGEPATGFLNGITLGSTQDTGYTMPALEPTLDLGASIGELLPFSMELVPGGSGNTDLVRLIVLENFLSTAMSTGTTNGDPFNLGAAATSEQLYAALHVTALSTSLGASISAIIQAASSSGFGTANTRVSFSAVTCKSGVWATPISPNALSTDQPWYRVRLTQSTGSSTGAVSNGLVGMAIQ